MEHKLNFLIPLFLHSDGSNLNLWFNRIYSLKYQRSVTFVFKCVGIRKSESMAKIQFFLGCPFLDMKNLLISFKIYALLLNWKMILKKSNPSRQLEFYLLLGMQRKMSFSCLQHFVIFYKREREKNVCFLLNNSIFF